MAEEEKATQGVEEVIEIEGGKRFDPEQWAALEGLRNSKEAAAALEIAHAIPEQIRQQAAEYIRLQRAAIGSMGAKYDYLESLTKTVNEAEQERREALAAIKEKGEVEKTLSLMATANALAWRVMGLPRILDYLGEYLEKELGKPEYAHLATMADMVEPLPEDPGRTWWDVVIESASRALEKENPARYKEMLEAMGEAAGEPEGRQPREPLYTTLADNNGCFPVLNGYPLNDFMALSKNRLPKPDYTNKAIFPRGSRKIIVSFFHLSGSLGVSAKKLLILSLAHLTRNNCFRGSNVNPSVTIDLMQYWEYQNFHVVPRKMQTEDEQKKENRKTEETIKKLKQKAIEDLHDMKECLKWRGQGTGENKGSEGELDYISSWRPLRGNKIRVNFDIDFATYMIKAYLIYVPITLLLHDNRDSNGFSIGYKIACHNSMDSNVNAGTNNTLSVRSLLAEAPDIPTIEELEERGRRDWKAQIKARLEQALEKNKTAAPVISEWRYRDPRTGDKYTPEKASRLLWDDYYKLMVDFTMAKAADQEERRVLRAAEKAAEQEAQKRIAIEAAKELAKEAKGKRGRPRKNPEKSPAEKTEKKRGRPRKNPEK